MTVLETMQQRDARPGSFEGDGARLAAELRAAVRGEVRFSAGDRALYATDASNYRQVPIGVVIPRDVEDVVRTVALARRHGAPILSRGGGTSLAGQCCNTAVVMDFSKYVHGVISIDPAGRRARVRPGTLLDDLREAAQEHGLTFGPDPATHNHCTIGGMIGNDSCGVHSVMAEFYGPGPRTADNVEELEILTSDGLRMRVGETPHGRLESIIAEGGRRGEIYQGLRELRDRCADEIRARFPDIPRRVSGYNLPQLLPENGFNVARALVGSESTCVTVLEATMSLLHDPPERVLLVLGYPDVFEAGNHVPVIREHRPIGLEGIDHHLIDFMRKKRLHTSDIALLPDGRGWLLVEFGGDSRSQALDRARELMAELEKEADPPSMKLYDDRQEEAHIWEVRESGLGATAFVPGESDSWPGWEDSAVPVDRVGDYLRDLRALLDRHGYACSLYGHFGQGCIHTRIDFDLKTADGIDRYEAFTREAAELVIDRYRGSLSGEHGDGQARADLLPLMFGDEIMRAFREFKAIWDPDGLMNPGKIVDAHPRTSNFRLGTDYRPATPETHFQFPDDAGGFPHATMRCVGVGKCRRKDGGTMCPSFMVLHEEKHTTRGRAHLLFEMLQGDVITDGWKSEEVRESLDLCLACKGCKGDCPVNVDIATYKAEFLSHYYDGRLRPRHAWAFGLIDVWARLAERAPALVNFVLHAPVLGRLAFAAAGLAPERSAPRFARTTFRHWFARRAPHNVGGRRVLLWPDTFNDHFFPDTLAAAVAVLEDAGCRVVIPDSPVCCGRPLYDFGMLHRAKAYLRRILDVLRPEIAAGTPVVGLEPSCVSVFRDEMAALLGGDEDAERLRDQTHTLGEFLIDGLEDYSPPSMRRKAMLHGHCHHTAIMKLDTEAELLQRMGLDLEVLDSGCCGMAGSFGFEKERYGLSIDIGERVLLPAVRAAAGDTLIIADGFSCREQILQATGRRALHLAEVLRLGLTDRERSNPAAFAPATATPATWAGLLAGAAVGGVAAHMLNSRR